MGKLTRVEVDVILQRASPEERSLALSDRTFWKTMILGPTASTMSTPPDCTIAAWLQVTERIARREREAANAMLADIARQLGIGINDDPVAAIDELQRIKNEYREANTEFSKETHNLRITVKMQEKRIEELRGQLNLAQATIAQQSDWIKNHKKKEKAA
jgi:hypothetical protein